MGYSARPTSTDLLTKLVIQAAHGFVVGQVVTFNGTNYVLAQADVLANCNGIMMVSIVVDANNFYVTQAGWVSGIVATFTPGSEYYLSAASAGSLTNTPPSGQTNIIIACFLADTAHSGYFISTPGIAASIGSLGFAVVTTNTSMAPNTVYATNSAGQLSMLLPAAMVAGQTLQVVSMGTGGFVITQGGGQSINFVQDNTTTGAGGSITLATTSGVLSGNLEIICLTSNTLFKVIKSTGNFTVV
jgi:hypothetical protein